MLRKEKSPKTPTLSHLWQHKSIEPHIKSIHHSLNQTRIEVSGIDSHSDSKNLNTLKRSIKLSRSAFNISLNSNIKLDISNNDNSKVSLGYQIRSIISNYNINCYNSMKDFKQRREFNNRFSKSYHSFQQKQLSNEIIKKQLSSLKARYSQKNINLKDSFIQKNTFKKNPLLMKSKNEIMLYYTLRDHQRCSSVMNKKEIDHLERLSGLVTNSRHRRMIDQQIDNKSIKKRGSLIKLKYQIDQHELKNHQKIKEEQEYALAIQKNQNDIKAIKDLLSTIDNNPKALDCLNSTQLIFNNIFNKAKDKTKEKRKVNCMLNINDQEIQSNSSRTHKHKSVDLTYSLTTFSRMLMGSFNKIKAVNNHNKNNEDKPTELQQNDLLFYKLKPKEDKGKVNNNINQLYESVNCPTTKEQMIKSKLLKYFKSKNIQINLK